MPLRLKAPRELTKSFVPAERHKRFGAARFWLFCAKEKLVHEGQEDNKDDHCHKWRTDALGQPGDAQGTSQKTDVFETRLRAPCATVGCDSGFCDPVSYSFECRDESHYMKEIMLVDPARLSQRTNSEYESEFSTHEFGISTPRRPRSAFYSRCSNSKV